MRLLFSAGAGYSHIAPLLPLAQAAQGRGIDVVLVTGPNAVEHAQAAGVPTIGVGPAPDELANRQAWGVRSPAELAAMSPDERLAYVVTVMARVGAGSRLAEMLDVVRDWRPDLVVAGLGEFAAVAAAAVSGVPYVVHAIGPPKSAEVMAGGWDAVDEIVRPFGLDRLPDRADVPYLDLWPDPLRPANVEWDFPTRWPVRPEGVMPVAGDRPAIVDGLPYEQTVYVTAGTSHNTRSGVLEASVSALHDQGVNVVVTIGRNGDLARFGTQPDHVRIAHYLPQAQLLPHVDVVVCHAGAGTVLGALAHGVPLVVAPMATDQFDTAAQVADAHAGVIADSGAPSRDGIRDAVRLVRSDPSYRESAAAIATRIAAMPTPETVLDQLIAKP
jgi:UDP:flavonoid glycosyltransferase YjiC (YdhE family)